MWRLHKKKGQTPRLSSGQSTVEYVLLVTAVVLVILAVTQGVFKSKFTQTINNTAAVISDKQQDLDTSEKGTAPKSEDATLASQRAQQHRNDNAIDVSQPNNPNLTKMP